MSRRNLIRRTISAGEAGEAGEMSDGGKHTLAEFRAMLGMTQQAFAEKLRVAYSLIRNVEGRRYLYPARRIVVALRAEFPMCEADAGALVAGTMDFDAVVLLAVAARKSMGLGGLEDETDAAAAIRNSVSPIPDRGIKALAGVVGAARGQRAKRGLANRTRADAAAVAP